LVFKKATFAKAKAKVPSFGFAALTLALAQQIQRMGARVRLGLGELLIFFANKNNKS
jgi:hypothetical protein